MYVQYFSRQGVSSITYHILQRETHRTTTTLPSATTVRSFGLDHYRRPDWPPQTFLSGSRLRDFCLLPCTGACASRHTATPSSSRTQRHAWCAATSSHTIAPANACQPRPHLQRHRTRPSFRPTNNDYYPRRRTQCFPCQDGPAGHDQQGHARSRRREEEEQGEAASRTRASAWGRWRCTTASDARPTTSPAAHDVVEYEWGTGWRRHRQEGQGRRHPREEESEGRRFPTGGHGECVDRRFPVIWSSLGMELFVVRDCFELVGDSTTCRAGRRYTCIIICRIFALCRVRMVSAEY